MVCDMETTLDFLSKLSRYMVDSVVHIYSYVSWNREGEAGQFGKGGLF